MTHALLFATRATATGSSTALLPDGDTTVVESLVATLRSLPVDEITVVARPAWVEDLRARGLDVLVSPDVAGDLNAIASIATKTEGSVVLAAADIVAHRRAWEKIAGVRVAKTVAAVSTSIGDDTTAQPIMRQRDQVISVQTHAHDVTGANIYARGAMAIGPRDRTALIDACSTLRTYASGGATGTAVSGSATDARSGAVGTRPGVVARAADLATAPPADAASGRGQRDQESGSVATLPGSVDLDTVAGDHGAVGLVLLALVRAGVPVSAYHVRFLHLTRVDSEAQAVAEHDGLLAVDETDAALQASKKEDEEFLATYLVQSYTPYMVRFFARHGITPNAVTWTSIVVAAGAVAAFASGNHGLWVLGAVLLYVSFVFDCCDGGVARFAGGSTRFGGWFDMISDRIKEYGVYAGLAVGGVRAGESGVWALALAAITVMTVRHMIDTWYNALQEASTRSLPVVPLSSRQDRLALRAAATSDGGAAAKAGARLGQLSASAHGDFHSARYYLKRSVVLPIGDRWLILAIAAAIWGPKIAFIVLLAFMALAFAYIFAGRTLRAVAMRVSALPLYDIALQRDDGLIARGIAWRLPPLPVTFPAIVVSLFALAAAVFEHPYGSRAWLVPAIAVLALVSALGGRAPHARSLDWLVPAALRAVEILFILVAGAYGEVPQPLIYALIATVVLVHYEISSRTEKAATPMGGLRAALGWDGRIVILAITTALGYATAGFAAILALVAVVLIVECVAGLIRKSP